MIPLRNSLIRHCEVSDATAATAVATEGRWWWLKRTFLDCRGRQGSLAKTSPVGLSACIFGLKKCSP